MCVPAGEAGGVSCLLTRLCHQFEPRWRRSLRRQRTMRQFSFISTTKGEARAMDDREEELREFMDHALDGIIFSGAKIISSLQQVSHPQHRQGELGVIAGIQQMFTYVDRAQEYFNASRWLEARQANRLASARLQAVEQSLEFKNLIESNPISSGQNVRPIYDVEELLLQRLPRLPVVRRRGSHRQKRSLPWFAASAISALV